MSDSGTVQQWYDQNKYYILFVSIVLLILAPPFLYDFAILSLLIYVLISVVLVNCLLVLFGRPKNQRRGLAIGVVLLIIVWSDMMIKENYVTLNLISNGLMTIIFGFTFWKVIREIFGLPKVSGQVVIGAMGAYLLLGLMGAFLFDVIEILYPHSFNTANDYSGFYSEIYLSFVTISTLGYGDITPITPQGQAAAIFVSISGQLYLAILMAMLVGKFMKDTDW